MPVGGMPEPVIGEIKVPDDGTDPAVGERGESVGFKNKGERSVKAVAVFDLLLCEDALESIDLFFRKMAEKGVDPVEQFPVAGVFQIDLGGQGAA